MFNKKPLPKPDVPGNPDVTASVISSEDPPDRSDGSSTPPAHAQGFDAKTSPQHRPPSGRQATRRDAPLYIALFRVSSFKTKYGQRVRLSGIRWHDPTRDRDSQRPAVWDEFSAWVSPDAVGDDVIAPCFAEVSLRAYDINKPPRIDMVRYVCDWDLVSSMQHVVRQLHIDDRQHAAGE